MRSAKSVLRPERLRQIERPFGWLPCRLLTDGLLTAISPSARQLYLVLALAADRQGLSSFGDTRLQRVLDLPAPDLAAARAWSTFARAALTRLTISAMRTASARA